MAKQEESIEQLKKKVKEIKEGSKTHAVRHAKPDDQEKKIEELTDTLQRLQAEFENYRKYVEKSKAEFLRYSKADLIANLLPLLDSFELALKSKCDKEDFIKGIELIYSQFYSLLEKAGLKEINTEGKLDPHHHEVLMKVESDKEEDTILEELQKGYMLGGKVLRYAKVKVSKKKNDNNKDSTKQNP